MLFFRFNILISRLSLLEAVSALIIFLCAYNVLFSARAISHAFLCETYLPFYSPVARGYGTTLKIHGGTGILPKSRPGAA